MTTRTRPASAGCGTSPPAVKARRGDLAVLVATVVTHVSGEPTRTEEQVEVEQVTGITRDGTVRTTRSLVWSGGEPRDVARRHGHTSTLLLPASRVADPVGLVAALKAHTWPGHTQPRPFPSVAAVRRTIRPFLHG